ERHCLAHLLGSSKNFSKRGSPRSGSKARPQCSEAGTRSGSTQPGQIFKLRRNEFIKNGAAAAFVARRGGPGEHRMSLPRSPSGRSLKAGNALTDWAVSAPPE